MSVKKVTDFLKGLGLATPNPVLAGANTLLTVAVTPGANPASTGSASSVT
jgi:hypothetical protein